jgi:hypothetical protein
MRKFGVVILSRAAAKNLHDDIRDPSRRAAPLRVTCLLFCIIAMSMLLEAKQVRAQSGIEIESTAVHQFGEYVTFVAQVISPIQIESASILIFDEMQGISRVEPILFQDGRAEYRLDARQKLLRPFSLLRWHFQLTLVDGAAVQSKSFSMRYDDNRFDWQRLEAGALRLMWYQGGADFGQSALNAALAGLNSVNDIVPIDLSQPIDIFIYPAQSDLPPDLSLGAEQWLAGHASPAMGVIVVVIESGGNRNLLMEQRIPHELMHVMLYRRLGAGYNNLPAWLSEGIAIQAEIYPNTEYDRVLADASARNGLIPLRDLCASFSPHPAQAFLAYAQARSFTAYLRDRYGISGLLSLAGVYADGVDCERGVERAFGVPLARLEADWRATVLGQNTIVLVLGNLSPYLVLLCLVLVIPFIGILSATRRKGNYHEPERFAGRK